MAQQGYIVVDINTMVMEYTDNLTNLANMTNPTNMTDKEHDEYVGCIITKNTGLQP